MPSLVVVCHLLVLQVNFNPQLVAEALAGSGHYDLKVVFSLDQRGKPIGDPSGRFTPRKPQNLHQVVPVDSADNPEESSLNEDEESPATSDKFLIIVCVAVILLYFIIGIVFYSQAI